MNPFLTPQDLEQAAPRTHASPVVAIVGLGYVGLPTALAFAATGATVLGIDVSERRLADIAAGTVDLVAADRARLAEHLGEQLRCTSSAAALALADAVVVCVPTPVDSAHKPDLGALRAACGAVVEHARPGQTLVLTSTTYVGATRELLVDRLRERGLEPGSDVFVAFAPERIDPGNTRHPQETVPRVVGGVTQACAARAAEILALVAPVHQVSSPEAAELTKLHENTFRAVNIAYAFEIARAAASYGLDVEEVIGAAASKPFGFMPFRPGPGVGGHCIPCDPHYLLAPLEARGVRSRLVEAAMTAIADRPQEVVERVLGLLSAMGGRRVLVVGAAYKAGVADMRESSACAIIAGLLRAGVELAYHDPLIPTLELENVALVSQTAPDAADYDLVVLACMHPGTEQFWLTADTPVLDCLYNALPPTDVRRRVIEAPPGAPPSAPAPARP